MRIRATCHYTYDAENRIATAAGWTYSYDGDGNRVLSTGGGTTGNTYWYGFDGSLTDEMSVNLNPTTHNPSSQRDYYLNGHLVYRASNAAPNYYLLYDQIGSTRVSIDSRWNPTTNQYPPTNTNYYPFGGYVAPPTDTLEQRFTGKERDSESGNDYFGARYYSSAMGRFLSPDFDDDGDPEPLSYADFTNPQTLNLYSYVQNNPLKRRDIDGQVARS